MEDAGIVGRLNAASLGICRWRAADWSKRSNRSRPNERHLGSARCGRRFSLDLEEKDDNIGQWETGQRGEKTLCCARTADCTKSVARFLRDGQEGRKAAKRPVRRPSGTPPSVREGSFRCQREKTVCCACSSLVRF